MTHLDPATANQCAATVLRVLGTPWPYGAAHQSSGPDDCDVTPERLHPCFHGSLDWHSSCHMQWSALTLVDSGLLDTDLARRLTDLLDRRLTASHAQVEADYLRRHQSYERPYGWGWLAVLAGAATRSAHPRASDWAGATGVIADAVADHVLAWLPRQALPVRHGVHSNSAFGLALLRDGFQALGRSEVVEAIDARARTWFGHDTALPVHYEPSGTDFLSPSLCEADLMRRVLDADEFAAWLPDALPLLGTAADPLLAPPPLAERSDGQLVHLFGLCLSRAAMFRGLAARVDGVRGDRLRAAAGVHRSLAMPEIDAGDFMSTHWLVSFLLLGIDLPGQDAASATTR